MHWRHWISKSSRLMQALTITSCITDDGLQDLLNQIQNILSNSDHLPVIFGQAGAGKTSLLNLLISRTNDAVQYFVVEGNEFFNAYNVFAGMLEAFQIPAPSDLQACLDELAIQLRALEEQKLQAVILIDDAHGVNPSELYKLISGMLYMRDGSDLKSFRIALTAKPEFEERLEKIIPPDTELHYTTLPLPKLDGDKTGRFIAHHLKQAGYFEPLPLDNTQIQSIRRASNGLPGTTCREACNMINEKYHKPSEPAKAANVMSLSTGLLQDKRLLGVIAGALILISVFLFTGKNPQSEGSALETGQTPSVIVSSEPLNFDTESNDSSSATESDPASLTQENANGTARLILLSEVNSGNPDRLEAASKTTPQPALKPPISPPKPKASPPASETEEIRIAEPEKKPEPEKPVVSEEPAELPAEEPTPLAEPTESVALESEPSVPEATQEEPPTQSASEPNLQSPNWVLMQDPLSFTVQVIASSDKQEVERFLAIHKLDSPNSIFSFKRGSETWYSLVHGLYPTIEEAQSSIKSLPDAVQAKNPWIRQIRRIHSTLKESG